MKKILALILAATMLFSIVACSSAYDNYGDYISLDLSKLSIEKAKILEKVADQILALREKGREGLWVELDPKTAVAQNGDKLNIDYDLKSFTDPDNADLKLSDDTKKGMKSEGFDLVLGSNSFIGAYEVKDDADNIRNNKGFEEQLIGAVVNTNETDDKKEDDKIDVLVTFPDNYKTKELQGVIVTFEVTVNSISRSIADITNEELIASLTYVFNDPDAKDDDSTEGEGDATEGEGSEGEGNTEGDTTEGDTTEGDTTEGDTTEGDTTEGDVATAEADAESDTTEGEGTEGDATEGDGTEGDATEGEDSEGEDKKEETTVKFADLFKGGKLEIDFSSEDFGKFNTIFDIKTVFEALEGKTLYEEFDVVFTVPSAEDLKKDENDKDKNDKFEPYAGREITVTFTLSNLTVLPEWNDEYVKKQTQDNYKTVKDYEDYLYESYAYEMALTAIIDAADLEKSPEKEIKEAYKNALKNNITSIIRTEKNADRGVTSTSSENYIPYEIGDLTQAEYDKYITEDVYTKACEDAANQATIAVKTSLVYEYLFDELEIELSNKEYKAKINEVYKPNKKAYKSIGIGSMSDYVEYMYGGKEEAMRALKMEKLNEKKADVIALITVAE